VGTSISTARTHSGRPAACADYAAASCPRARIVKREGKHTAHSLHVSAPPSAARTSAKGWALSRKPYQAFMRLRADTVPTQQLLSQKASAKMLITN
jgi:hypothetical protein